MVAIEYGVPESQLEDALRVTTRPPPDRWTGFRPSSLIGVSDGFRSGNSSGMPASNR